MAVDTDSNFKRAILVETTKYAGNFEREMCAYATGSVGECCVGEQHIDDWEAAFELRFGDDDGEEVQGLMDHVPDDNGYCRPASIWPGIDKDDTSYNTVIMFFHEWPEEKYMDFILERVREYGAKYNIGIKRIVRLDRELVITDTVITDTHTFIA